VPFPVPLLKGGASFSGQNTAKNIVRSVI
jgi:hypothetical protein